MANSKRDVTVISSESGLVQEAYAQLREQGVRTPSTEELEAALDGFNRTGARAPYDLQDVDDLISLLGDLGPTAKDRALATDERYRAKAMDAGIRALAESEERAMSPEVVAEVEAGRMSVFSYAAVPFPSLEAMCSWIEEEPEDWLDPMSFLHVLAYPGRKNGVARRQVQIPTAEGWVPSPGPEAPISVRPLEDARRASRLGRLYLSARKISSAVGCHEYQGTALLLLGWTPYVPPITVSDGWSATPLGFSGKPVTLRVNYPWVSAGLVRDTYLRRNQPVLPTAREGQRRARSARIETLRTFKDDTPELNWAKRWRRWNHEYPRWKYQSALTMKNSHINAERRKREKDETSSHLLQSQHITPSR